MIIGLNGLIGSGKDTFARYWQYAAYYNYHRKNPSQLKVMEYHEWNKVSHYVNVVYNWEIKKWAAILKKIASDLTGIPVEKFEDREFKKTFLGPEWCKTFGHIPQTECMTVREFLQKLGTNAIRDHVHQNTWVNALMKDYKSLPLVEKGEHWQGHAITFDKQRGSEYPLWMISDTRFPNEAQAVKDKDGYVFNIVKQKFTREEIMRMHESERALIDWPFDEVIDNSGTLEDLCNIAISLHSKYIVL